MPLVAALLFCVGCSDEGPPEWDRQREVIVQLFLSQALVSKVGTLLISARQGDGEVKEDKIQNPADFFATCESNRLRIIPQLVEGQIRDAVELTISSTGGAFERVEREVSPADPQIVLGPSADDLAPAGCAPAQRRDAGAPDVTPDAGAPKRAVGEPCTADGDCEGGLCLDELRVTQTETRKMKGGYCTSDCSEGSTCASGSLCKEFFRLTSNDNISYCIVDCSEDRKICRDGYLCTTAFCIPVAQ